ncbi:outer membrane protein G [Chryseobacterium sp. MDT2-18]|nr:outer membrane protein G [Chryseobacterium sp. MDT2-18]
MHPLKSNKEIMKKIFLAVMTTVFGMANAQTDAFRGAGDTRYQIGMNIQDGGTGVMTSLDYGLGESFSIGAQAGYLLGAKVADGFSKPSFGDRFDIKARFNANLGGVLGLPQNIDVYPGLNLGLKNFGGHLGARVFFDKGFGLFAEAQVPFAKYNDNDKVYKNLNNQFQMNVGVSFDLSKK